MLKKKFSSSSSDDSKIKLNQDFNKTGVEPLKIAFVKTTGNVSDGMTENVSGDICDEHFPQLIHKKSDFDIMT